MGLGGSGCRERKRDGKEEGGTLRLLYKKHGYFTAIMYQKPILQVLYS